MEGLQSVWCAVRDSGVYWKGAIHWFSSWGSGSEYYNFDEERMGIIPVLPVRERRNYHYRESKHYGESGGHLHLIETYGYGPVNRVDVYEMARDYSMRLVKYRVNDLDVGRIQRDPSCSISVLCVVRMERDEDLFMVLHIPGDMRRGAPEGFDDEGGA
ncbi:hypothetical protein Vadar_005384 [Vaccinium darrowii]|uniref:Uncharacterized protein n=1 Tax=Vaccinium darrowii TaxID=229202 RepID=A0ACB7YLH7_9ERIC|nr:hypothetical protein Vadar_005384 [Vaccinium darrowii]